MGLGIDSRISSHRIARLPAAGTDPNAPSGSRSQADKHTELDRFFIRSQIGADVSDKGSELESRTRMPELDDEGAQSTTSEEQLDEEEKTPADRIDYAKAFGRWRNLPHYCWGVSRGFWVAGEKDKKQGVPSDDTMLANGMRPNWKPRPLVPVGTENPDYKHTIEDLVKAASLLSSPPRKVRFEDEEDMRRVYSLIYDVFRYKTVLTEILHDGKFFNQYPSLVGYENLVMLMLYDLYKRYFTPRPNNSGELNGIPRLRDVHQALAEARIHVAASFGRIRIKNQVCSLTDILPERLKDEKVVALEKSLATAWVNTSKARYIKVDKLIESTGLTHKYEWAVSWQKCDYRMDHLCPKFFMCDPASRGKLLSSEPVQNGRIVVQDRSFCLAPALLNKALLDFDLTGKVVQTHMNSPRTTAYLANLLSENTKLDGLIVFGAQERKEEVEEYLQKLEIRNTLVIAERFIDISPDSELLRAVSAVLANPPNTYSGVLDPVDLVCSRGGDMEMLELLTESETDRQRVMDILEEQKQTLRIAMCRPQIQLVMYETHSIVEAENSNMVIKLVNEMNQIAYERYLEEQSKLSKSAKSEEEVRDTETVLKEETPESKEEEKPAKDEGEDQEKAETKSEASEEVEVLLQTTEEASEIDAEGAVSLDYNEDANQGGEEDVLTEKVELKTFEDAEVPPCDLFEIGELPDLCPHKTSCLDLKEEGCYIALLKRKLVQSRHQKRLARDKELEEQRKKEAADAKELVSLDAKYMISVAEMRGLFGGGPKKTSSGRGYRRRELLSMRSGSGSSGASQKARGRAAKIDLDRLTAPTVASMLRTAGFEPSEDSVFVHSHRRNRSDDSSAEALAFKSEEAKPKPTFAQQQAAMRRLSAPLTRRIVSKIKMDTSSEEMYVDSKKVNEKEDNDADIMYGDDDIEFSDSSSSRRQKQPTNHAHSTAARKKELLEKEYVSFLETKSKKQWQGTSVAAKASKDFRSPERNMNKRSAAENIDEIYRKEDFRESIQYISPKQTRYTTSTKPTQEEKSDIKNMDVRKRGNEKDYISLLEGTTENIFNEFQSGLETKLDDVSSLSMRSWRNALEYGKFSEAITPLVQLLKTKLEVLRDIRARSRREIYDEEDRETGSTIILPSFAKSLIFNELSDRESSDYNINEIDK